MAHMCGCMVSHNNWPSCCYVRFFLQMHHTPQRQTYHPSLIKTCSRRTDWVTRAIGTAPSSLSRSNSVHNWQERQRETDAFVETSSLWAFLHWEWMSLSAPTCTEHCSTFVETRVRHIRLCILTNPWRRPRVQCPQANHQREGNCAHRAP